METSVHLIRFIGFYVLPLKHTTQLAECADSRSAIAAFGGPSRSRREISG